MNRKFLSSILALVTLLALTFGAMGATPASAAAMSVFASNGGIYDQAGSGGAGGNYFAGFETSAAAQYRAFFVFDLTSLGSGTVNSATLRIFQPAGGYSGCSASETYNLYDISTSITSLSNGSAGVGGYTDMGSGTTYGNVVVPSSSSNTWVEIPLNASGLAAISSALGSQMAVGGALSTIDCGGSNEGVFSGSYSASTNVELALDFTPSCSSTITVTTNADSGAGSLRQAIADICADGTIDFDNDYAITLTTGELAIAKNLTIDGTTHAISISGNNASRVFNISSGNVTLNKLTIQNGSATEGGGISNDGSLTVKNSTLTGNNATTGNGGAIKSAGALTVGNSTFISNTASNAGAGIWTTSTSTATVYNSTFITNSSPYGGALNNDGTLNLLNTTISGNSASGGGSLNNFTGATLHMTNSIIANTTAGVDCTNGGTFGTNLNNLIEDNSCGGIAYLSGDPLLSALTTTDATGTPYRTGVFPLNPGSPAINAGDNVTCNAAPVNNTDQGGYTRIPSNGGATCDIGSYEFWDEDAPNTTIDSQSPTAASTALNSMTFTFSGSDPAGTSTTASGVKSFECQLDGGGYAACTSPKSYSSLSVSGHTFNVRAIDYTEYVDATPASYAWTVCPATITVTNNADSGAGSLRQAIADACDGATINFDANYTITLTSGQLVVDKALTITGASRLIYIDGNNASRVINATAPITLQTLALQNGNAGAGQNGGGLNASTGATLNSVSFFNNTAAFQGGGAYINGATVVTNSTFSGNKTTNATGGFAIGGALRVGGNLTVTDSYFVNNTAASYAGAIGGDSLLPGSVFSISGSTFSGNSAPTGGAVVVWNPTTIKNSTFDGNTSNTGGGALALAGATTLNNVTIANSSNVGIQGAGPVNMTNTVIAYTATGADCAATLGTNANNLIEDNTCSPALSGNPKLGTLAANSFWWISTMPLLSGSPAINAGNNGTCEVTDQRGAARPQGASCDIGAYEATIATIARANANPTDELTVQFTVNFSSSVTGVTAADFKLTNSLITGTSITGVTGSGSGPYTVTASTGAGNGSLRLDIIGKGSYLGLAADATYIVDKGVAPTVPLLKTPLTGVIVPANPPTLLWNPSSQVMALAIGWHYDLNVTSPNGFNTTYQTAADADPSIGLGNSGGVLSSALPANTTFTWKVRACNDHNQCSAWSLTRTFRTKLATPALNLPENNDTLNNKRPTFEWDAVDGATSYTVQIFKRSATTPFLFTVLAHTSPLITAPAYTYTPTLDLLPGTEYQWKVKANGLNAGDYSAPFTFTTSINPPKPPLQALPATGTSILSTGNATLTWGAVVPVVNANPALAFPAAATYDVQVSTNAGFANISPTNNVKQLNVATTNTTLSAVLAAGTDVIRPGRTYYWRVRSVSAAGNYSSWSVSRTILVKFVAPGVFSPIGGVTVGSGRPTFQLDPMGNGLWTNMTIYVANAPYPSTLGLRTFIVNGPLTSYTIPNSLLPLTSGHKYWYVKINGLYTPIISAFYWDFFVP